MARKARFKFRSAFENILRNGFLVSHGLRRTDKEELNGERAPVCPVISSFTESLDGCVGQQLADDNSQVDTCGGDTTNHHRGDLFKDVSE